MRYTDFLFESAASELAAKLPSLKKQDYSSIDKLMKRISRRHAIDGKELHDVFVKRYGRTPDNWIKKYNAALEEESTDESMLGFLTSPKPTKPAVTRKPLDYSAVRQMGKTDDSASRVYRSPEEYEKVTRKQPVTEDEIDNTQNMDQIRAFVQWSIKTLNVQKPYPKIKLSTDTEDAQLNHRTGMHTDDGHILVYIKNRNLVDIFRTLFHELVHERQDQLNMIGPDDSYPGSPVEAMADMMAGKYIKIYGKKHPEIFQ